MGRGFDFRGLWDWWRSELTLHSSEGQGGLQLTSGLHKYLLVQNTTLFFFSNMQRSLKIPFLAREDISCWTCAFQKVLHTTPCVMLPGHRRAPQSHRRAAQELPGLRTFPPATHFRMLSKTVKSQRFRNAGREGTVRNGSAQWSAQHKRRAESPAFQEKQKSE